MEAYEQALKSGPDGPDRVDHAGINARARNAQARMIFAEGDDVRVLRAAVAYQRSGLGKALVVGRDDGCEGEAEAAGLGDACEELEVVNAATNASERATRVSLPAAAAQGP
jgi:malate dehydrogenase (oxaloacetate-decarboxylating)(NADP+)